MPDQTTEAQEVQPRHISLSEFALMTARPETRIIAICIASAITGVVLGVRQGWTTPATSLLVGAVLSVWGMLALARAIMTSNGASALGGLIPYTFGCYLLFFRGIWNGRALLTEFSFSALLAALAFIFIGYRLVFWTWQLSEIADAIRTGKLVVGKTM